MGCTCGLVFNALQSSSPGRLCIAIPNTYLERRKYYFLNAVIFSHFSHSFLTGGAVVENSIPVFQRFPQTAYNRIKSCHIKPKLCVCVCSLSVLICLYTQEKKERKKKKMILQHKIIGTLTDRKVENYFESHMY